MPLPESLDPQRTPSLLDQESRHPGEEAGGSMERHLRHYVDQLSQILWPVLACIMLSVLWSKISLFRASSPRSIFTVYAESTTDSSSTQFLGSLANAGIILGLIVIMTIVIVILFKYNCTKILYAFFGLTVANILGFTAYLLWVSLLTVVELPMDYITTVLLLFNFAVAGILAIFTIAPKYLQQTYLVIMSSLMAFSLTNLQEWTTWCLLGLLVVWDLVAVLCPFGPLRILVETSQRNEREIPALLYSACVWVMMANQGSLPSGGGDELPMTTFTSVSGGARDDMAGSGGCDAPQKPQRTANAKPPPTQHEVAREAPSLACAGAASSPPLTACPPESGEYSRADSGARSPSSADSAELPNLKLGLGDFVFYSVLVGRASLADWITTLAATISVLTGLTATIFLLAMFQKALPALPISITAGIVFYFGAIYAMAPFLTNTSARAIVL